jgi:hypothetical protein
MADLSPRQQGYELIWNAARRALGEPPVDFDPGAAIPQLWMKNYQQMGSVLEPETDVGGGWHRQTFVNAVVEWNESTGANIVNGDG